LTLLLNDARSAITLQSIIKQVMNLKTTPEPCLSRFNFTINYCRNACTWTKPLLW